MRRILLVLAVIAVGSLGVVTAATAEGGRTTIAVPAAAQPAAVTAPAAVISYTPAAGAAGVQPATKATATVRDGAFDSVTLTDDDGKPVAGEFNADKTVWSSTAPLAYGASYTWGGSATGANGAAVPLQGSFATTKPSKRIRGTINIGDGRTVGIAAPIRIQFNDHVADRAAAERALKVETSVPVEGAWGWLPDEGGGSRVDWRPKVYWPANTKVTVTANLRDVFYGGGAVGAANLTSTFQIGRAQIVKADAKSFRMIVIRDGQQVFDFPASYGLASDPQRNTRSGVHVVSEKFTDKRMVSQQYGYDSVEKWAVRMSNNGEFIHANPNSAAAQGSANVTHGCVNLSIDNAKAYYDTALYGDPVEVTNTPIQLSARDGDIWDWTLSWDKWKALSAL
ncbi:MULTISPECIES: Ig-like domain-containing protein [unclassified Pseudonocardia]|jgi:lipoprotein-anchoring transpeptidase ErfK/SrfK|uniref:L,D-transpeptidase n=1 Tax=unclassified Pseudonocardia TaxID=2619320 RepID=UPI0009610F54|nr:MULTISPECIES: Ig-like domain-containing protein [unclassified Pseudonocardia]MBN9100853.1 L,D-transpeptidase family protein [Pseudonocardia sp.]OJY51637.1 MAG: L,D-transpeptidase [Pseudonocardia sp. 73-21]